MRTTWVQNKRSTELILFCAGWGMDATPFRHLKPKEYDILFCYDYSDLPANVQHLTHWENYQKVHLISWSMGVLIGQKLFQKTVLPWGQKVAINGTLCPLHDNLGIPEAVYNGTLANFNEVTRQKFYRRMCRDKRIYNFFLGCQPQRDLENQMQELARFGEIADCLPVEESIYTRVLVSDHDYIMPTDNQLAYWGKDTVVRIPSFHYPFSQYRNWEELLQPDFVPAS